MYLDKEKEYFYKAYMADGGGNYYLNLGYLCFLNKINIY